MKKTKILLSAIGILLFTGCMGATVDVALKKDDTGTVSIMIGYEESYLKEVEKNESNDEINSDTEITIPFEDVQSEKVTFKKSNKTYIGEKATVEFDSLEQLSIRFNEIFGSDEDEKLMDTVTFVRDGSEVTVSQQVDPTSYEQSQMLFNYIDYTINFKIDGNIISQNADNYNEKTNELEWDIKTVLKEGIQFKYKTGNNLEIKTSYIIIALSLIIVSGTGSIIYFRKKKK